MDLFLYVWTLFIVIFVIRYALFLCTDAPWHMTPQLMTTQKYDSNTVSMLCSWSVYGICVWVNIASGSFVLVCQFMTILYSVLYLSVQFVFTFYWFVGGQSKYTYKIFLTNICNLLTCPLELNQIVNPGVPIIVSYYVLQFIQNL